jgi:hypothetical protein
MIRALQQRLGGLAYALAGLSFNGAAAAAPNAPCPAPSLQPQGAEARQLADRTFAAHALRPGQVTAPPKQAPRNYVEAEQFGAAGNGSADDTAALQAALRSGHQVWLRPGASYRITRRIELNSGQALVSDGSALVLMDAEAFDNRRARRSNAGIYSTQGTGLQVHGEDILLQGFHLVRLWTDDRYVIGIDVTQSKNVSLLNLRLRGFSLAPGIVTIRSSNDVTLSGTLINESCSATTEVPEDIASLQVTGISVDDSRVGQQDSHRISILDNVILGVVMVPNTYRGNQSDGINFAGTGSNEGSVVEGNWVAGSDEGLDIFGRDIAVRHNRIEASSVAIKLIHGARNSEVLGNEIHGGRLGAIGIYTAKPAVEERQVRSITVRENQIHSGRRPPLQVDSHGTWAPSEISLQDNTYWVADCGVPAPHCPSGQCRAHGESQRTYSNNAFCAAPPTVR